MKKYDLVILGSGPGGYVAALYAAKKGRTVCVIEKDQVGGACLNRGCIPTKVMLHAASVLRQIKTAGKYGIEIKEYTLQFSALAASRDAIVNRLRNGIVSLFTSRSIMCISGRGSLKETGCVEVNGEEIRSDNIIIATGSRPLELPSLTYDGSAVVSSDDALTFKDVPRRLLIVGGGVIGCEFAQIFSAFGSKVTIVELREQILPEFDREIARRLSSYLKKDGISVLTSLKVDKIDRQKEALIARISDGKSVEADKILVSVGRSPNTEEIGLERLGIRCNGRKISVDRTMSTNVRGVWAIGDIADGGPMLAHAASYEGIVACDAMLGEERAIDYSVIPNCVYTEPGIATVGMGEEEAKKRSGEVRVAKFPFTASGKANVIGKTEGFIKVIGDRTGKIMGIEIFGSDAHELIGEASLALSLGANVEDLARTVHCHPTLSEIFQDVAHSFLGTPIHTI